MELDEDGLRTIEYATDEIKIILAERILEETLPEYGSGSVGLSKAVAVVSPSDILQKTVWHSWHVDMQEVAGNHLRWRTGISAFISHKEINQLFWKYFGKYVALVESSKEG